MAGNSQRRGAMRKTNKKGAVVGSGGQRSKGLQGKGPTPPAEMRPGHPAQKRAARTERADSRSRSRVETEPGETVLGRGPVLDCLRAGVPATALHVAVDMTADDRVTDSMRLAADRGVSILQVPRSDMDRITSGALHQGLALQVPPYTYTHPDDVLASARSTGSPPLVVALDGVADPRVLGSVVRSAQAFGAHGVLVPARRSVGMTAVAWRSSAGAAAGIPVARATNLTRTLRDLADEGLMVLGLDAQARTPIDGLDLATGPLVVVLGSQGRGLTRLVREACDATASITIAGRGASLNATVAAGLALAEIARVRRG